MSVRQAVGSWCAALGLLCVVLFLILRNAPADSQLFTDSEIAVVGSSLVGNAMPEFGDGDSSPFANGERYRRFAINSISESEVLRFAEGALQSGVKAIFLEADPFIKRFQYSPTVSQCDGRLEGIRGGLWLRNKRVAYAFRYALGRPKYMSMVGEPENLNNAQHIRSEDVRKSYPLILQEPHCGKALAALVQRASAQGTRIILLQLPRSQSGAELIGPAQSAELRQLAERLADQLGVALFAPEGPWPNDEFADMAHLNMHGRAHFLATFRQWLGSQP